MPELITAAATIMCSHGGRVVPTPRQATVMAQGGAVLCEPDLVGAPIVGCAQPPSTSTKPCTTVVAVLPGSTSPRVAVGGRPAYVSTLQGITDGLPPGTLLVVAAGTTVVLG